MKKNNENIWVKASVIGSLWASVEIIMGSFFHNLQLPFAGTMLAIFTVAFIISVMQIWRINGLIWRAGLICAIMKSISPSAVILGPMTGIFLEAVLLELFIFILGKNIFGYIIAGAMAVLSALFHKLITLLLIYGWDAVKILSNLYNFAMKQLHVTNINPLHALIILISIYVFLGITASIIGYKIGKKALVMKTVNNKEIEFTFSNADNFISISNNQKYSVYLLIVNIFLIIIGLFIINFYGLIWGLSYSLFFIIHNLIRYKDALKQFKRPFLWGQLILLTILASLFYVDNGELVYFSYKGTLVGLEMAVRAIIVILGFSSISIELRNPIIKTVLYKKGFSNLYNSLGLAFSALPTIITNVSKPKKIFTKPFNTIVNILLFTDSLYLAFINNDNNNNR